MPSQVNLDPLYNPVPTPAPLGEAPQQAPVYAPAGGFTPTQQNLNSTLAGTQPGTVTPGYGGGGATVTPMDMSLQSNVMGAVGLDLQSQLETKTVIPEGPKSEEEIAGEEIDRQTADFEAADEIGGRGEARKAKSRERKADRLRRQEEFGKALGEAGVEMGDAGAGFAGFLPKAQRKAIRKARGKRRSDRKSERSSRKDAWKTYKGKEVK